MRSMRVISQLTKAFGGDGDNGVETGHGAEVDGV